MRVLLFSTALVVLLAGCDENRSKCLKEKDLSSCKAACDRNDQESCKVRDEVWVRQCLTDGNMDACKSACDVSKDPKACDKQAGGKGKPNEAPPSGSSAPVKQLEGGGW